MAPLFKPDILVPSTLVEDLLQFVKYHQLIVAKLSAEVPASAEILQEANDYLLTQNQPAELQTRLKNLLNLLKSDCSARALELAREIGDKSLSCKIAKIKQLREEKGIGLAEAKALIEQAQVILRQQAAGPQPHDPFNL
jgi:ribosomal protein L7/L12